MTESVKATRSTVALGSLTIDGFMLSDGDYRMSQTQAAECVGLGVQNVSDFLRSKTFKALSGEGYTPQIFENRLAYLEGWLEQQGLNPWSTSGNEK